MAVSPKIRDLIHAAWADDCVCLLGTVGKDGPNISPKGSMIVYDDEHLAYWERSKRKALENLGHDPRVVVVYGRATVHGEGKIKDAIFAKLLEREQKHDGADQGVGVLIKIERAQDVRGRPLE
jgi:hypothetical protein